MNTINASYKQTVKGQDDLYFLLLAPILMILILGFFDSIRVRNVSIRGVPKADVNCFYLSILIFYVALKLFIGWKVGFRFFNFGVGETGDQYVIPGWSGASSMLQWILIIFIPYVRKKYVILAVIAIITISGVLHVKRGDVVRVFCFLLLFYSYRVIFFDKFNWKSFLYFITFVAILSFLFSVFGQLRLAARGSDDDAIIQFLGSRIDSVIFSWLYGYLTFGFEVLSLYYDTAPSYDFLWVIKKALGFELATEGENLSISAFNAPTFLVEHVKAFGDFYFLSVMLYSLLIAFLVFIIRMLRFFGGYLFVCSLLFLMVFGDYFLNRSIFFSIIVSIFIFPFLNISDKAQDQLSNF